ncbi:MAG: hypothetical protein OXB88_04615 [Bacteriovoracales bacterium]|nr:hypothetical protein [Bacteriovoracales bacterium]
MKKTFASIALAFSLSLLSHAQMYDGTSTWNGNNAFSFISMEGVKMQSIEEALKKCLESGARLCSYQNSKTNKFNNVEWSYLHNMKRHYHSITSTVESLDDLDLSEGELYTENDGWLAHKRAPLTIDGVRAMALMKALHSCYNDGYRFCVLLTVPLITQNQSIGKNYYINAEASVQGYKLRRE